MTARRSPLHFVQDANGCMFRDDGGWLVALKDVISSQTLTIQDCSYDSNLLVEGNQAADLLRSVFGNVPTEIGRVISADIVDIGRLSATKYGLRTRGGEDQVLTHRLNDAVGEQHIAITNQTEGLGGLLLEGTAAPVVLSMLCGLDFSDTAFPVGTVKMSSFAKVRTTIWRSPSTYRLYAGRSYLAYLLAVTEQAVQMLE